MMTRLGLTLNRTGLCEAQTERFDFLGYSFGLHHPTGRMPLRRRQPAGPMRAASEGQGRWRPGAGQHGTMR
jgi:hypothetical protein